jgi:DNA polymerase-3 subunit gamma/tau
MLMKGLGEARVAPNPLSAVDMVMVRLAYVAELPAPAELVKVLAKGGAAPSPSPPPAAVSSSTDDGGQISMIATATAEQAEVAPAPEPDGPPQPTGLADVIALAEARGEMVLATHLRNHVRLVRFETGRIEFQPTPEAPPRLANELGERLTKWTGARWVAVVSSDDGAPTLGEQAAQARGKAIAEAEQHPLVKAVLDTFPDAKVTDVRPRTTPLGDPDEEETT